MNKFQVFCINGDVIKVEPDHTLREVTQNDNAMVAMCFRQGKILHAETCSDMQDATDTVEAWVKIAGGMFALAVGV